MKKFHFSLLFVLSLLVGTQSFAQYVPDKGSKLLNVGVGVGGYGFGGYAGYGFSTGVAIGASFEAGVYKNITVGGFADYRRVGYVGISGGTNYIYIGARGSYHFNELLNLATDKADLYAGIGLGYLSAPVDAAYYVGYSSGKIILPIHLGGRYFFSDKVGGFAELASDVAPLKIGVTFKL